MKWSKTIAALTVASGLAIPAIAAQAQQPVPSTETQPPAADPSTTNDPTATTPSQGPSTSQPTGPGTSQPSTGQPPVADAAPATPGNPQVVAFVNSQFPQADTNGDGSLSKAEFDAWVSKMKVAEAQQQGKSVDQAEVTTYATQAFAQADADKSQSISRTELTHFLQG